jgi:pimeloyl-ACP methyl ester carboxylesterase
MPGVSDGPVPRPVSRTGTTASLFAADGVRIAAVHRPPAAGADPGLALVVAHGFTGSWRRPALWGATSVLRAYGGVVAFDMRGHGASGGASTVGDREILDLDAAVRWARSLGHRRVATVGFSMGGSVVVRHAALLGGADAVVAVSAPSRWHYHGTPSMRRVHLAIERRGGRLVARYALRTRVSPRRWNPVPEAPEDVAGRIAPVPLLVVHGDRDAYFPVDHPRRLYEAAREPRELWLEPGFGHAENAAPADLLDRIGAWCATRAHHPGGDGGPRTSPGAP